METNVVGERFAAQWDCDVKRPSPGQTARQHGPGRKMRACFHCRRLKMKCELLREGCKRCSRKGLQCTISPGARISSPSLLEPYEEKIDAMRQEIQNLSKTLVSVSERSNQLALPANNSPSFSADQPSPSNLSSRGKVSEAHRMAMTRENSPEPVQDPNTGPISVLVTEPMGGLYEVTRLRNIRSNQATVDRSAPAPEEEKQINDFISRGVIDEEEAEDLYRIFHISLNHYLWVGLEQIHSSLASVRRSSQILTSAILTVTALHIPSSSKTFDDCYNEFLNLVSSSMFSRYHSVDDVRALCIAAFWLSDVSWKLSGHAIRIATELNIHQSFFRALEGNPEHFLRARLWYMLYVCDHHFSIAYGRPPMISESLQIREHETFLRLPLADALDFRILSQVNLFQIMTRVHDCFAERRLPHQDTSKALLSEENFPQMRNFNLEIDRWRISWHSRQKANKYIGTFPPKGIVLYSYFAKFQLNSFAVRGINISEGIVSTERKEFANMAVSAAASSLSFVLEEEDLRRALVGTPLYVHTMIAFTSVFLMKVATKWNTVGFNIDSSFVWDLLERVIHLLKTTITSKRHLLSHIGAGLEKMRLRLLEQENQSVMARVPIILSRERGMHENQQHHNSFDQVISPADGSINPWTGTQLAAPADLPIADAGAGRRENPGPDPEFDQIMSMSSDLIYEVFGGNESSYDVYNLLSSQFAS